MRADDGTRHDRAMTRTDTPPPPVRDTAGEDARPLDSEEVDSSEWSIWAGWEAAGGVDATAGAVPSSPAAGMPTAGPPTPPRSDAYRTGGEHRPVVAGAAVAAGAVASSTGAPSGQAATTVDGPTGAVGAGADPATGAPRSAAARRATGGTPVAARAGGTTPAGNRRASRPIRPGPEAARRRRLAAVGGLWAACLLGGLLVGGLIGDDDRPTVHLVEVEGDADDWRSAPAPGSAGPSTTEADSGRPDSPDRPTDPRRTTTTDPTATTGPDGSSTTTTEADDSSPPDEDVTTTTTEPDTTTSTTEGITTTTGSTTSTTETTTPDTTTTTVPTGSAEAALDELIPF